MISFAWRHVERSVPVFWGRAHTRMVETTATMESGLSRRAREASRDRVRLARPIPQRAEPLIGPAPRSAMFFPLVVLVAVLPGLVALNSWDLTPPGPLWGLRALAVLDGLAIDQVPAGAVIKPVGESTALRAVSFQPPLYAWLAALGMRLSADLDPLATVLPSYVAGVDCRRSGLPAWPALAWWRHGPGSRAADRVQPQPAPENAGGHADHAGAGRSGGSPALLWLARACHG